MTELNSEIKNEISIFLKNVTHLRKKNNISKKEMAKILGVGISTLNKIESGELPPKLSADIIFKIHNHFQLVSSQLFKPLY